MFIRQKSYWDLTYMLGNKASGRVEFAFRDSRSGQLLDFDVSIEEAEELCAELARRIHQTKTGEYIGKGSQ